MGSLSKSLSNDTAMWARAGTKYPGPRTTAGNKGRARSGVTSYEVHHHESEHKELLLGWAVLHG